MTVTLHWETGTELLDTAAVEWWGHLIRVRISDQRVMVGPCGRPSRMCGGRRTGTAWNLFPRPCRRIYRLAMTTYLVSEDWQYMPPADVEIDGGTGSIEPSDRRIPAGKWHAAEPGSTTTLCGHPIRALFTFPDHPFNLGMAYDRCDVCERRSP